jgi:hypothetical protein
MSDVLNANTEMDVHDSVIESLAVQYEIDEKEIRLIYEQELSKLKLSCRIKSFLPVLCTRHVKEIILRNF